MAARFLEAPVGTSSTMRLYITPTANTARGILDLLRVYGLPIVIEIDEQGTYIDITLPDYWSEDRQRVFNEAISRATL
jgi:hypothetical protein